MKSKMMIRDIIFFEIVMKGWKIKNYGVVDLVVEERCEFDFESSK